MSKAADNAYASQFPGMRNGLINGDFRINQRGVSVGSALSLSDGEYFFDRWRSVGATTGIQVSSAGVVTLGSNEGIEQVIEDGFAESGETVTISVEDPSSSLTITLLDYSETDTSSGTISGGSGRKDVTLTVPALDADGHLIVRIEAAGGATFSKVQTELGSVSTPFERRNSSIELHMCQRYLWRVNSSGGDGMIGVGHCYTTDTIRSAIQLPTPLRSNPSVSFSGISVIVGGTDEAIGSINIFDNDVDYFFVIGLTMGASSGTPFSLDNSTYIFTDNHGHLELDAEL